MFASGYESYISYFENGIPNDAEVISEAREGKIYRYKDCVIKERKNSSFGNEVCKECIKREYVVGSLINQELDKIDPRHEGPSNYVVKTIGYFEDRNASYIITKYVKGQTLESYLESHPKHIRGACIILASMIYYLSTTIEFTHYDLHFHNVIVEKLNYNIKYKYGITSNLKLTIIDISRSHVKGISSMYAEIGVLDDIVTPGVHDPIFDLASICLWLKTREEFEEKVDKLLDRVQNESNIDYEIGSLHQNDKVWASITPGYLNVKQVNIAWSSFVVGLEYLTQNKIEYYETGFDFEDEPEFIIENKGNNIKISKSNENLVDNVKEEYIKLLGQAMVKQKLESLKKRSITSKEFFFKLLKILTE